MSDGIFQDSDIIRRIGREGVLIAAGGAASILQTSHPGVGQGVYDHTYTFKDPLGRLQNTMEWLYVVQFGTRAEAERLSAIITRIHRSVTGPGYAANDPELQVWVGATLFDVALRLYQALFGRLSPAEVEEFYQQSRIYAQILNTPAELQPATYEEFTKYFDRMVTTLEITEASRRVAHQVLHPRVPRAQQPGLWLVRLLTAGFMPAPLRAQYGWAWNARRERQFVMVVNLLRIVYPRIPLALRTLPREYCLRTFRAKSAKTRK
ncbi:MAG: oxygenase MpaB family protein [Streptosporangiaceae bacterium]